MGALETIEFDLTLDEARRWVWITSGFKHAAVAVAGLVLVLASLVVSVIASAVIAAATIAFGVRQQRASARVVDVMVRAPHRRVSWDAETVIAEGPTRRAEFRAGAITKVDRRSGFLIAWSFGHPVLAVPIRALADPAAVDRLTASLRSLVQAS